MTRTKEMLDDMQVQSFIQKVKYNVEEFLTETDKFAKEKSL